MRKGASKGNPRDAIANVVRLAAIAPALPFLLIGMSALVGLVGRPGHRAIRTDPGSGGENAGVGSVRRRAIRLRQIAVERLEASFATAFEFD